MKRPIRIDGDTAYVLLTKGYEAMVDIADLHIVDGFNWQVNIMKTTSAARPLIYAQRQIGRKTIMMHRAILNPPDDLVVDHRDSNGLNNRRSNLRAATESQNHCNRRLGRNSTSGVKGVHWSNEVGKWCAQIGINKKTKSIGYFRCITAAAFAYAKASRNLHGEFGRPE